MKSRKETKTDAAIDLSKIPNADARRIAFMQMQSSKRRVADAEALRLRQRLIKEGIISATDPVTPEAVAMLEAEA